MSSADVERVVRREFPAALVAEVMAVLDEDGGEPGEPGRARVQLAALKLANGRLDALRRHVASAKQDFRDVLAGAEYPEASRDWSRVAVLSPREQQQVFDADWEQYRRWLDQP